MTLVLTGLDIERKAAWAEAQLFDILGGKDQFDEVDVRLLRFDREDAPTNEQATAHLRITVKDADRRKVGRRFSNTTMELALAGYAGFHTTTPPSDASDYGVYWPTLVPAEVVTQRLVLADGSRRIIEHTEGSGASANTAEPPPPAAEGAQESWSATVRTPLGRICGARSGDKGGNANVGLWAHTDEEYAWLRDQLTVDRFRDLLTEARNLAVRRYELPNLRALNFVVVGLLGSGVADSTRPDPQAKGLGEYIRSRHVDLPASLLASPPKGA
jgi:hypothetical protein